MKLVLRRLGKLEARYAIGSSGRLAPWLRLIVTRVGEPENQPPSTCDRYVRNGNLTEIVRLNNRNSELCGEELERFIDGFPIEIAGAR